MPKIEPIDTFASIFELPSRGSKQTTYFPWFFTSISIGFSSSSLAKMQHLPLDFKELMKTSFERMSNFLTESPLEFSKPAYPYSLAIPAFFTLEQMNLQAVYIEDMRRVKSPEASLIYCCSYTRFLVRVKIFVFMLRTASIIF